MRSLPSPELNASYNVPNSIFLAQLGRLPAGGTATGNQSVQLLNSFQLFAEDRLTQVDMRFAKVLRFGRTSTNVGFDFAWARRIGAYALGTLRAA